MGIQIEQVGAYTGKAGFLVGQRNKSTLYKKIFHTPHDPKTPAQQRNRKKFGNSWKGAEIAMQFNPQGGGFIDPYTDEKLQRFRKAYSEMQGDENDIHLLPMWKGAMQGAGTVGIYAVYVYEDGIDFIADEQELRIDTRVEFCLAWINKNDGKINGICDHFYYPESENDYWVDADLSTAEPDCDLAIYMYVSKWESETGLFYFVKPNEISWG